MPKTKTTKRKPPDDGLVRVTFDVPLDDPPASVYEASHVELRLGPEERCTLTRLFHSLNSRNVRLPNGRHVASRPDALRWLLAKLAEAKG